MISYCVNLDKRPDRWEEVKAEFARVGLSVTRFPAIDGTGLQKPKQWVGSKTRYQGALGLSRTYCEILSQAKERALPEVLLLEDDCVFADDFQTAWRREYQVLPDDWQVASLGSRLGDSSDWKAFRSVAASRMQQKRALPYGWHRPKWMAMTHAFLVRASAYDSLLWVWSQELAEVDVTWNLLWDVVNAYVHVPPLVGQRDGYSDILGKEARYVFDSVLS